MIDIGHRVEVLPAFDSETHACDIYDEITGCEGIVVRHGKPGSGYHVVRIGDEEHEVYVTRLRDLTRIT